MGHSTNQPICEIGAERMHACFGLVSLVGNLVRQFVIRNHRAILQDDLLPKCMLLCFQNRASHCTPYIS